MMPVWFLFLCTWSAFSLRAFTAFFVSFLFWDFIPLCWNMHLSLLVLLHILWATSILSFFYLYLIMENQIFPTLYFFTPSGTLLSSFYHFYFNSPYFPYIIACYLLRKFFHLIFHFYNQSFIHVHVGTYTIH